MANSVELCKMLWGRPLLPWQRNMGQARRSSHLPACCQNQSADCVCVMLAEALHLANLMCANGYIFPIDDHILVVKNDGAYYRFQVSCLLFLHQFMSCMFTSNYRMWSVLMSCSSADLQASATLLATHLEIFSLAFYSLFHFYFRLCIKLIYCCAPDCEYSPSVGQQVIGSAAAGCWKLMLMCLS